MGGGARSIYLKSITLSQQTQFWRELHILKDILPLRTNNLTLVTSVSIAAHIFAWLNPTARGRVAFRWVNFSCRLRGHDYFKGGKFSYSLCGCFVAMKQIFRQHYFFVVMGSKFRQDYTEFFRNKLSDTLKVLNSAMRQQTNHLMLNT